MSTASAFRRSRDAAAAVLALAFVLTGTALAAKSACKVESAAGSPTVLELYTSEGCSSCPPADRWLAQRVADPAVVALAFHVDYWDRLGWKDRFADHAYTERQTRLQRTSGARFSYTPQLIVDGRDRPDAWDGPFATASGTAGSVAIEWQEAPTVDRIALTVRPRSNAPARLAGYWAVTEDGHLSEVRAGENRGATLHHARVVRFYRPLEAWPTGTSPRQLALDPALLPSTPGHARHLVLVVTDADTGRPVQAVQLGC